MRRCILWVLALCLFGTVLPVRGWAADGVPSVSAASAILMDADSGRVLFARDADTPRPIASITKLMTALVAAEYLEDLSRSVTIRKEWTGIEGTSLYLVPGEQLTAETLLYGLLLHSGNDAAVALAGYCAGDVETFVAWMNQRAKDLGMTNTHFADPNGLSGEGHYSTARDMARLAAACLENPVVAKIVATKQTRREGRTLINHNKLLWQYEGCTGMKTGYTRQAGRTLVSSARRDGQHLVCVTLRDRDDWADHKALLDYGFAACPRTALCTRGDPFGSVAVAGSLLHQVPVEARQTVAYPLYEGEQVRMEVCLPETAQAPVFRGTIAGSVRYYLGRDKVGETYLVWSGSAGRDVLDQGAGRRGPMDLLQELGKQRGR